MKKLIAGILPILLSTITVASAGIITQKDVQTFLSCNPSESKDTYYYIPSNSSNSITIYPDDTYRNTQNAFINKSNSSVDVYRHGIISQCEDWDRMSNMVRGGSINPSPQYPALIFKNIDGCTLGKPSYTKNSNPTAIDAQIHYTVAFNLFANGAGNGKDKNTGKFYYKDKSTGKFMCYPGWNAVEDNSNCAQSTAYYWKEVDYHTGECLNYRVFWCGDGLLNGRDKNGNTITTYDNGYLAEACDPKDPTHTGWGNGGCSNSCEPVVINPVCNSTYNGQTQYTNNSTPWLNGGMNLCSQGVVTNFQSSGTPRHFTWSCTTGGNTVSCSANQQWCGDGQKQTNHGETCDEGSLNGTPGHCSATCDGTVPQANPVCNSTYNGQTQYTNNSTPWLNGGMNLCSQGVVTNFQSSGTPRHFTWSCTTGGNTVSCSANQQWCGDGQKQTNHGETCDEGSLNGTPGHCSATCDGTVPQANPVCNSTYNGQTQYTNNSTPWLNGGMNLCSQGVVTNFQSSGTPRHFTWSCTTGGNTVSCSANQQWCGDGIRNGNEQCDHADVTNREGWGNNGCSLSCQSDNTNTHTGCDFVTGYTLRSGYWYIFHDWFNPEGQTRYLYDFSVNFIEEKDFNKGENPKFNWTENLTDGYIKVSTPKIIIQSQPKYWILEHPTVRSNNNLYIEYLIKYANRPNAQPSQYIYHKECANYEISRCGDGIIDKTWEGKEPDDPGEECDPGSEGTKVLPDGQICNSECKIETSKKGNFVIEKTLISDRYITQTGQEQEWKIKVTASGGYVKDVVISDDLPPVLSYVTSSSNLTPSSSVQMNPNQPIITSGGKHLEWKTTGILESGNSIVLSVITKVDVMPDRNGYENVACAWSEGLTEKCDKKPIETGNPHLRIKKTFTDGTKTKTVKIGDEISYKIDFGNNGNAPATITSIKDFLPKNVQYKTGSIHINRASTYSNSIQTGDELVEGFKIVDGVRIEVFGGMTLQPGDTGYIIITGIVKGDFTDNRTNFACIYLNDEVVACSDATHDIKPDDMKCENLEVPAGNLPNGGGSKDVRCTAGGKADLIEIDCGNGTTITGANKSELKGTCTYPSGAKTYTLQCKVNGETPTDNCKGSVTVEGYTPPSCFPAGTKVIMSDGTTKNIENIEEGDIVLSYNTDTNINEPNVVAKKLVHEDSIHEMYELTINGNVLKVTDAHRFYVRKSELSKDYDWIEAKELKVGNILLMSDGELAKIEKINHYKNEETVYNFEVDNNHNYFVDKGYLVHNSKGGGGEDHAICKRKYKDNGYVACESTDNRAHFKLECGNETYYYDDSLEWKHTFKECKNYEDAICYVKGKDDSSWKTSRDCGNDNHKDDTPFCKKHPDNPVCDLANPKCLNVNEGNFSIELGEFLPFYFNVRRDIESSHKFKFVKDESESCDVGDVDLGSLECTYLIRSPKDNKIVYSGKDNCLELGDERYSKNNNLIKKWSEEQEALYDIHLRDDTYGRYWPHIEFTKSNTWKTNDILGEYKFQIEVRKYRQCNDEGQRETIRVTEEDAATCQSNFVLTEPYTVQKTPSGNLTASTDTLEKFKEADGEKVSFASYLKAIATSEYHPNDKVDQAMETFINKYSKLAVSVKKGDKQMKKVPGKNIYFIDGDFTINGRDFNTAFTFVQTNPESTITIKGDSNLNMMILTKGNIAFEGSCTNNQNVKGIFYASGKLIRRGILHNDKLTNSVWCTKGGLNIKGVLIGNNFNSLMKNSRSHLENWFNTGNKRGEIMNGGSVVIEYSPSIFTKSTMPPGAEDFTTALSIYKQ